MKAIPLSPKQAAHIADIRSQQASLHTRETDFVSLVIDMNNVKAEEVEKVQLSQDGKALLVHFKKANNEPLKPQ